MTTVIAVDNLSKSFDLERYRQTSLKHEMFSVFRPGLRRRPDRFYALADISFTISEGERVGLIGDNGSGKSTLLKILSGIYVPNRGRVTVNGPISPVLDLGSGFNPELSGHDNVFLNASLYGLQNHYIRTLLPAIIDFAELTDWIQEPLKHYSMGMLLRLAFSVAVHLPLRALLLDDTIVVGDQNFQKKCVARIEELSRNGLTLIIAAHDLTLIRRLCSRALRLNRGRLIDDGPAGAVIDAYSRGNQSG